MHINHSKNLIFKNEKNLIKHLEKIAGYTLLELIKKLKVSINLKNKGWIGILLEKFLGIHIHNKPEQDFSKIGIELKTIPIDIFGRVLEDTFVNTISLTKNNCLEWKNSYVCKKLSRVLWIPIEKNNISIFKNRIGKPLIWSPNIQEKKKLKRDWEDLMDMIALGKINSINNQHGDILYLRIKGNKNKLTNAINEYGEIIKILPRAFYLRKKFTTFLFKKHFLL